MVNKKELIEAIALEAGVTRSTAESILNATLDNISLALQAGERVHLVGFGTFECRTLRSRLVHDIHTKKPINVSSRRIPVFIAGKTLKDSVR